MIEIMFVKSQKSEYFQYLDESGVRKIVGVTLFRHVLRWIYIYAPTEDRPIKCRMGRFLLCSNKRGVFIGRRVHLSDFTPKFEFFEFTHLHTCFSAMYVSI